MTNTVLVNGTGTIGSPLIALLLSVDQDIGLDEVIFYKHTARLIDRPMLNDLIKRGGKLCVEDSKVKEFRDLGIEPDMTFSEALKKADVVIDATKENIGMKNKKEYYEKAVDNTLGFMAQGSESDFGIIYAAGVNDYIFQQENKPKFVQIGSCNTHAGAAVLKYFGFKDNEPNIDFVDFTFIRRASDVSQTKGVQAPTITPFKDPRFGTHHAKDVWRIFKTMGYDLNIFSAAMKTNTQYMHSLYSHFLLKEAIPKEELIEIIKKTPSLAYTHKDAANLVFSFGRNHGHYGRILNQSVIYIDSLHTYGNHLYLWSFTPQDGNAILSSVKALLYYLNPIDEVPELMSKLDPWLFNEV